MTFGEQTKVFCASCGRSLLDTELTGIVLLVSQLIWKGEDCYLSYGELYCIKALTILSRQPKVCFAYVNSITMSAPKRGIVHMSMLVAISTLKSFPLYSSVSVFRHCEEVSTTIQRIFV